MQNRIQRGLKVASFSLFTLAFSVQAQTLSARDQLQPLLAELQSYKANFLQLIQDAEGSTLQQSEGTMSLQKPNKLRWEVSLPDASLFVADGEVIYNLDPFVEQVTLIDQADIVNNNPLMLLISDDPQAWENVDISFKDGQYHLLSKDDNANIALLKLKFTGNILQSLSSVDRQQQVNKITFSNIQHNGVITNSAFRVDIPESYVIDDQRRISAQP